MSIVIVEYRFLEPATQELLANATRDLDPALARHGAEWRRSYISPERLRLIAEVAAPDARAVEEAHREADVAWEAIWEAERWTKEESERERQHEHLVPVSH